MTERRPCGHSYIMPKTTIALPQAKGTKYDKQYPPFICLLWHYKASASRVYIILLYEDEQKREK